MKEEIPEELVQRIKGSSILALPQSAARVLELAKDAENGPPEYAVPISADPGLTAQILSFANSSFFGFRHKITTIQVALSLISIRTIKNFVLWNAVFALLPNPKVGPFRLKLVFQDALRRAVFCKVFADYFANVDPEEIFVAGLFQDIAVPVLANNWPKEYGELLDRLNRDGGHLSDGEKAYFGWNHAQAGFLLAREWGFGDSFSKTVLRHCDRQDTVETDQQVFGAIVRLSSLLPSADTEQWADADDFFKFFYEIAQKRFLGDKGLPQPATLFSETDALYGSLLAMTQTPSPPCSLGEFQQRYFDSF